MRAFIEELRVDLHEHLHGIVDHAVNRQCGDNSPAYVCSALRELEGTLEPVSSICIMLLTFIEELRVDLHEHLHGIVDHAVNCSDSSVNLAHIDS
jgi:hypothetical protein